jgi:3-oxoacyl-[acyl-carrier protein] reductase
MSDSRGAGPLAGRTAVVTGASRGIGAAIATRLAADGAQVVLVARGRERIEELASGIRADGGIAHTVPTDMTDRAALERLVGWLRSAGRVDVLVNNAGVLPPAATADATSWQAWDDTLAVNLAAPWYLSSRCKELLPRGGVVVNVASTASYYPSRGLVAYNASKAALIALTRVLALEWAGEGIRVVGVAPGKIDTDLVRPILAWSKRRDLTLNPQGRIGTVREVADLVAFLVSDQAGYLTGVTVPIDGGELLTAGGEPGR